MKTQLEKIKKHLEEGGTITQDQAARPKFGRCWRLSVVINRLRKSGMNIHTEMIQNKTNHSKHAKYFVLVN